MIWEENLHKPPNSLYRGGFVNVVKCLSCGYTREGYYGENLCANCGAKKNDVFSARWVPNDHILVPTNKKWYEFWKENTNIIRPSDAGTWVASKTFKELS